MKVCNIKKTTKKATAAIVFRYSGIMLIINLLR